MNTNNNTNETNQGRKFEKTTIYNGGRGWCGITYTDTDANGKAWQISTHKVTGGTVCTATEGEVKGGGFSYEMFGARKMKLGQTPGACTEKRVRELHALGLVEFQKQFAALAESAPAYTVTIGQILFTDGPFESKRRAVYQIVTPGVYKTVTLDGTEFKTDEHVKDYKQKFGIGVYYKQGDKISPEEVQELVKRAEIATQEREILAKHNKQRDEIERKANQAKGAEIIPALPTDAKAVIVARLRKDTSDPQSDYFGYSTENTVYLAFSTHTRDLFPELKKAADNFTETQHLGTGKGIFKPIIVIAGPAEYESNGRYYRAGQVSPWFSDRLPVGEFSTQADAEQWISEQKPLADMRDGETLVTFAWKITETEIEHREKYTGGSGYYLGESKYSGWIVEKDPIHENNAAHVLEQIQIAAGQGFYYIPAETSKPAAKPTAKPAQEHTQAGPGEIQVIDYSEKAFAVVGDTKPIKDKLKDLGGSFNARLTCGPGWIFSKKRLDAVTEYLKEYTGGTPAQSETQEEQTTHTDGPGDTPARTAEIVKQELHAEILETINFFEETDKIIHGHVTPGTQDIRAKYSQLQDTSQAQEHTQAAPPLLALPPASEHQETGPEVFRLRNGVKVLAKAPGVPLHYVNNTQAAQRVLLEAAKGILTTVYSPPGNAVVKYLRLLNQ